MAEHGYDFATEEDIENYLWSKTALIEDAGGFEAVVDGRITEEEMRPLIDEELAIAAADVACRTELDEVNEEVLRDHQGEFIDEHREQLEKIRELDQRLMEILMEGWQW
jgi:hypothetical protein